MTLAVAPSHEASWTESALVVPLVLMRLHVVYE
jgi:hypothetical protein